MEPAEIHFRQIRTSHLTSVWIRMRISASTICKQCYQTRV